MLAVHSVPFVVLFATHCGTIAGQAVPRIPMLSRPLRVRRCAILSARRTLIFTSTLEPRRLMIDIKTIDCEATEVRVSDAREVGCRNPGSTLRPLDVETITVKRLDNLSG